MADSYTKAILTVIALALVCIAIKGANIIKPAVAQSDQPVHVVIDSFGFQAFQNAGALQVTQR